MRKNAGHIKALAVMFGAYGKADDEDRILIYALQLQEIPLNILECAIKKCIAEKEYLPSIASLISASRELYDMFSNKEGQLAFDQAWMEIRSKMARYGYNKVPEWSTPELAELVKTIGWRNLTCCQDDNIGTMRAQCRDMYKSICDRKTKREANEYYLGLNSQGLLGIGEILPKLERGGR